MHFIIIILREVVTIIINTDSLIQMYISGMTVQKKRPTLKLSSHKLESKPI